MSPSGVASFLALSRARRALFLAALGLRVLVRAGFLVASFRRTAVLFERIPTTTRKTPSHEEISWAVTVAANQRPGTACLPRALVAPTLCGRDDHESSLSVDVDRDSETFAAHSWVEGRGEVVVGDDVDLARFEALGVVAP